jgi:predicted phage baseplate assembly protein
MPLQPPSLDDRDFDQIVTEAKSLIPRYTPEWTDHNDSDPGITLVKLFAWMTDLLIYRLNQVPELHYVKFLQLLGIELQPARPAVVDLTFTVDPSGPTTVMVPRGTQVAVAGAPGQPVVFETDRALVALRAALAAIQVHDGFSFAPVNAQAGTAGASFYPFGRNAREGSALYLGFDDPGDFPDQSVELAVYVAEASGGAAVSCGLDLTAIPQPATVDWEYLHRSGQWRPVDLVRDETRAFSRSGRVELTGPGPNLRRRRVGLVDAELYWLRARLRRSQYETAPRLDTVVTNTAGATQAQTVRDEVLGGSDGSVSQQFRLANVPVVALDPPQRVATTPAAAATLKVRSVQLEVDEGSGFEVWEERDDFFDSGPADRHFTVNRTTGETTFGNGEHGRIPAANPQLPGSNIVARVYRVGGGTRGNVGAGRVTDLQSALPSVASVTNRRPSLLGSEEESVEQAKLRAPQELKSKGRAVTAEDFEQLARATPGARVRRAKALPLTHPRFPEAQVPGVVTVLVVPDTDAPNPLPNETTLRAVCAWLDRHRLLTTEVHVAPPHYRKLTIEADVAVEATADLGEVKQAVEDRLTRYFHPLHGGEDGLGWGFGDDVYFSDVARVVLSTPGVDRIRDNNLFIWLDADRFGPCEDVAMRDLDLLYTEGHQIDVSYRERA